MAIYLVRHAKAGQRDRWLGDDSERPLSGKGERQAEQLADRLMARTPTRLVSSPFVRCRQTLEPLAKRLDLTIEPDKRLAEGAPFDKALDLITRLPDGAVLCSHGDVIPDVINALVRRGIRVKGEPDWRKGSVWVLRRDADRVVTDASAWPPPDV